MLIDAKLPQKFWAEALSMAVYLCNRSPTKAVNGMTPLESLTGEKPTVRVFDCAAYSVKCQLSDYVFLRRVLRRTIIAKTSNLHQKVGYRQDYKYRKLHVYTPKTLTVVLSLVQTRKNQLSATGTHYRKSIHRSVCIIGSTS